MCLGIPGQVVAYEEPRDEILWGIVEFSGVRRRVSMAFVPETHPGEYVIVHAGVAISRIDAEEAERTLALIQAIGEAEEWTADPPDHQEPTNHEIRG